MTFSMDSAMNEMADRIAADQAKWMDVADAAREMAATNQEKQQGLRVHTYEPNSLSYSRRRTLKGCPRRFFIEHILGLERKGGVDSQGLRMGAAHAVGLELQDPEAVLKVAYQPLIEAATDQYMVDALMEEALVTEAYVDIYLVLYEHDNLLEPEWEWNHGTIGDTKWIDRGASDGVLSISGRNWMKEDKLLSQWGDAKDKALDMDEQVTAEIRAAKLAGLDPVGVKYRVTKKASIRRRTKRDPETIDEFLERLRDKLIKDRADHFMEFSLTRTDEEIKEFEEELLFAAEWLDWMLAREADGLPSFPRQPATCSYLGGCAHPELCRGLPDAEALYVKKQGA